VNNPDLLYFLTQSVLPVADDIPGMGSFVSIHDVNGLFQRAVFPVLRTFINLLIYCTSQKQLDAARAQSGLAPNVSVISNLQGRVILVNSAFGLEYPRALPPTVHMVGPMFRSTNSELSPSDQAWLDMDTRPVVFVSMGTLAPLSEQQVMTQPPHSVQDCPLFSPILLLFAHTLCSLCIF
jgi:hypothetical protein